LFSFSRGGIRNLSEKVRRGQKNEAKYFLDDIARIMRLKREEDKVSSAADACATDFVFIIYYRTISE